MGQLLELLGISWELLLKYVGQIENVEISFVSLLFRVLGVSWELLWRRPGGSGKVLGTLGRVLGSSGRILAEKMLTSWSGVQTLASKELTFQAKRPTAGPDSCIGRQAV